MIEPLREALGAFHFLRPAALLLVVPVAFGAWRLARRRAAAEGWRRAVDPHLLRHLLVHSEGSSRIPPLPVWAAIGVLSALALAGPTWTRAPNPFGEERAALVIAFDLSPSMDATDIQPSRLERARQKVHDFLALRSDLRAGLIAYSGSAHVVLPLTDDPRVLETFLPYLDPSSMPVAGRRPALAIDRALDLLASEEATGSVLLITDDLPAAEADALEADVRAAGHTLLVLAAAPPQAIDRGGFAALSSGTAVAVTPDDADVRSLARGVRSLLEATADDDLVTPWKDAGVYLLWPIALLSLLFARPGYMVRCLLLGALLGASLAAPRPAHAGWWDDLWFTPDQQGHRLLARGEAEAAAQTFEDPFWKGLALYASQQFEAAEAQFALAPGHRAAFDRANALAHLERYREAAALYDAILAGEPDHEAAAFNRKWVQGLLDLEAELAEIREQDGGGATELAPDAVEFSDTKSDKGESVEVEGGDFDASDPNLKEVWMRRVQHDPADFLASKFAYQARNRPEREDAAPQEEAP